MTINYVRSPEIGPVVKAITVVYGKESIFWHSCGRRFSSTDLEKLVTDSLKDKSIPTSLATRLSHSLMTGETFEIILPEFRKQRTKLKQTS